MRGARGWSRAMRAANRSAEDLALPPRPPTPSQTAQLRAENHGSGHATAQLVFAPGLTRTSSYPGHLVRHRTASPQHARAACKIAMSVCYDSTGIPIPCGGWNGASCPLSLPPSLGCAAHAPPPVARSVRLVRDRPAVPALPHHRLDLDLRPRLRPHRTRPRPHPRDQRLEAVPRVLGRPVRRPRGQRGARLHGPRARREGAVQTVAEQAQPRPPAVPRPRRRRPLGVPPHPPSPRLLRPTLVAQHAVLPPDAHIRTIQPRPPRRRPPHPGLPPRDPPARVAAARQPEPVRLPRHRLHPARFHPERQKRAGELAPRQGVDRRQLLAPVARPGHRPPRPPPLLLLDHPGALYFFSSTIFL